MAGGRGSVLQNEPASAGGLAVAQAFYKTNSRVWFAAQGTTVPFYKIAGPPINGDKRRSDRDYKTNPSFSGGDFTEPTRCPPGRSSPLPVLQNEPVSSSGGWSAVGLQNEPVGLVSSGGWSRFRFTKRTRGACRGDFTERTRLSFYRWWMAAVPVYKTNSATAMQFCAYSCFQFKDL